MKVKVRKININKILILFLLIHLFVWTLAPSISNSNLPLDTIEALAWGTNLDWGYNKHPPISAWSVEFFYRIFGNQDWAYYFLSQIYVIAAFYIIYKFSEDFFKKKIFCLISVLLLEGIYFYNFTTPEFNVNVSQLPFWALTVYYCWEGIKFNKTISWLLFGFFAALGVLSKYLFIYLLLAIDFIFIYLIIYKKINYKCLISLISFFAILSPHLIWLVDNNYTTITYAFQRTGFENLNFFQEHLINPLIFLGKQIGILIPFLFMIIFLVSRYKIKFNLKDKKLLFLLTINIVPVLLIFFTSLFIGIKIRTMWMTPFYLFIGVLIIYLFKEKINLKKIQNFFFIFFILFILSPSIYIFISISQNDKRTDYNGKEISQIVQKKWNDNFLNKIGLVGGDEWHGGNLSYHLNNRPIWDNIYDSKTVKPKNKEDGFVFIGEAKILSQICVAPVKGLFFEIEDQGICMIGKKK